MKITVNEVETFYQQMGQGSPLVLLHGWGCDWQIWHTLIAPLSQKYQLLIPDLPVFGQSANPPHAWNSLDYVEWLAAFIAQVTDHQKVILLGHSFGGKVAALYAVKYTEQVDKLVLIDSSGIPDDLTTGQTIKQSLISLIPEAVKQALPATTRQKFLEKLRLSTDHATSTQAQRDILRQVVHENIREQLTLITKPTLLIWGANDLDTPIHQAKTFQQSIANSQLVIVPATGHFPFLDQPQMVLQQVQEFLR